MLYKVITFVVAIKPTTFCALEAQAFVHICAVDIVPTDANGIPEIIADPEAEPSDAISK